MAERSTSVQRCAVCGKPVTPRQAKSPSDEFPHVAHSRCVTRSAEAASLAAEVAWTRAERECPQCQTRFTAVGNQGSCPRCGNVFYASHPYVTSEGPEFPYIKRAELGFASGAQRELPQPLPYKDWPRDQHQRASIAEQLFGLHLMRDARNYAWDKINSELDPGAQAAAREAAMNAIYGVMMMLEGVATLEIDSTHWLAYRLSVSVEAKSPAAELLETYEIASGGDGLCMGFHGWREGDFGDAMKPVER